MGFPASCLGRPWKPYEKTVDFPFARLIDQRVCWLISYVQRWYPSASIGKVLWQSANEGRPVFPIWIVYVWVCVCVWSNLRLAQALTASPVQYHEIPYTVIDSLDLDSCSGRMLQCNYSPLLWPESNSFGFRILPNHAAIRENIEVTNTERYSYPCTWHQMLICTYICPYL